MDERLKRICELFFESEKHNGELSYENFLLKKRIAELEEIDIVHCKDCKHWTDSDGVYRRGCNAESKCRVNCKEVMSGDWFCADGERDDNNG